MLEVSLVVENEIGTIKLKGRADTVSSECAYREFENGLNSGCKAFIFDLLDVEYICSATLRVFLKVQKVCKKDNIEMRVIGASEGVKDVFEITGFSSIINIE